jgi:hypothetical protein
VRTHSDEGQGYLERMKVGLVVMAEYTLREEQVNEAIHKTKEHPLVVGSQNKITGEVS